MDTPTKTIGALLLGAALVAGEASVENAAIEQIEQAHNDACADFFNDNASALLVQAERDAINASNSLGDTVKADISMRAYVPVELELSLVEGWSTSGYESRDLAECNAADFLSMPFETPEVQ